jgi:hypothetical protein
LRGGRDDLELDAPRHHTEQASLPGESLKVKGGALEIHGNDGHAARRRAPDEHPGRTGDDGEFHPGSVRDRRAYLGRTETELNVRMVPGGARLFDGVEVLKLHRPEEASLEHHGLKRRGRDHARETS